MRGATPLDVAAASVIDNNELALSLREPDLEKVRWIYLSFCLSQSPSISLLSFSPSVSRSFSTSFPPPTLISSPLLPSVRPSPLQVVQYLAGCGLQSCPMLVSKGYLDLGWNPVEGERYLDMLRFSVFCNGKLSLIL